MKQKTKSKNAIREKRYKHVTLYLDKNGKTKERIEYFNEKEQYEFELIHPPYYPNGWSN